MKLTISVTDTEIFKKLLMLMMWMFRRLNKTNQVYVYNELQKLLGGTHDLKDFEDLKHE